MKTKEILKKIKNIHLIITVGYAAVLGVLYFLVDGMEDAKTDEELFKAYQIALIIAALIALGGGYFIGKRMIKKIPEGSDLVAKLVVFQKVNIIRLALVEMAGVVAAIGFYNTMVMKMFLFAAFILLYMLLDFPTPKKLGKELGLSEEEVAELKNK